MKSTRLILFLPAFAASAANVCDVRLNGCLGERLDRMIERHVGGTDVAYITAPFLEKAETKGFWQTEFWGKYMHSAVPFAAYSGSKRIDEAIRLGVGRVLSSQEPSGYVGNYPDALRCGEGWDVWGMKYTLMGLLHAYDRVRRDAREDGAGPAESARILTAAKRLCDYVIAEVGPEGRRGRELWETGNWSGYASSSILEPVVWLRRRVAAAEGEAAARKYMDFASYIVRGMTAVNPKGPRLLDLALKGVSVADRNESGAALVPEDGGDWTYVCKHGRGKAYEMMSCYQGLLDYVEEKGVDGETDAIFRAALLTAEDIAREEVTLAGGCASSEAWFHGAHKQHVPYMRLQETCVTTTWMRLCEKLLSMTGDPKWADLLERAFYNAYLAAMKADGSAFAGYTPLSGSRCRGQHHCHMHTDCCTANGPRGFLCFLNAFFTMREDTPTFNFYASARTSGRTAAGQPVAFEMYALYPRSSGARLVSHTENVGVLPVRFRIPAWSGKTTVRLNGRDLCGVRAGTYFTLRHEWRLGDVIEIAFDMPVVAHVQSHHVAFTRGPVLLARDSRFCDGDLTEPFRRGVRDGQRMEGFAPVRAPSDDFWMAFSATLPIGGHHENPEAAYPETVSFCDYASAGCTWRRDDFYRTWFPIERAPESR